MLEIVSEQDVRQYEQDGVVCLRGVIDPQLCERLLEGALRLADNPAGMVIDQRGADGGRYFMAMEMSKTDSLFRDFAMTSRLPFVAAALMGTKNIRFYYDPIFLVEPRTETSTPWHNALPYWAFEGSHIVSLWVALTAVTRESSPLQYLRVHIWKANSIRRLARPAVERISRCGRHRTTATQPIRRVGASFRGKCNLATSWRIIRSRCTELPAILSKASGGAGCRFAT